MNRAWRWTWACVGAGLAAWPAAGQFNDSLPSTEIVWILGGDLIRAEGAPPIQAGDQIGAFSEGRLVGRIELSEARAAAGTYAELRVFGDDPDTSEQEGPPPNGVVTFGYFDASTNTTITDVRAVNDDGEPVNLAYQGGERVPFPFPIPGLPDAPSATVDLRIGVAGDDDGGGGDGGGGGGGQIPEGDPDVDGDGEITRKDAALVLRVVVGGTRLLDQATVGRADVNGDGVVSTEDAIAVLRAR